MLRRASRILNSRNVIRRCVRGLTQSETSTALRPFYFAVHPDLFTQHPRERSVNEESLKILNSHVELLLNSKRPEQNQRLPFYIRDPHLRNDEENSVLKNQAPIRLVKIPLESDNLQRTVSRILEACDLSTDYVDKLKPKPGERPFVQEGGGIPNPEVFTPKPPLYLSTWIRKNIDRARQYDASSAPVLMETERLRTLLRQRFGLLDVRWASKWGLSNYHACLKRFQATADGQSGEAWVRGLEGHTLVFGSETGITALGEIVLSSDDVPQDWLSVLTSVRRYDRILYQLPRLEMELSSLLHGIEIARRSGEPVMADRYCRHLLTLIKNLESDRDGFLTGDLSHLQLSVESAAGPLAVAPDGQFLVPCSCPGSVTRNFIEQTKINAAKAIQEYLRSKTEEEMIIAECRHALNLRSLTKDDQISHAQMRQACVRLLDDVSQVGVALTDMRLRVSQFYSVMNSGEMVIPWNWIGYD